MDKAEAIAFDLLGGAAVFGRKITEPAALRERLRSGLPYRSLELFVGRSNMQARDLLSVVHIPMRTLYRRRKEKVLSSDESDRLYRVAKMFGFAEEVLGDRDKAIRWLTKPHRVLGETPLSLLDTEIGARQVEDELRRIDHGVIA